MESKYLLHTTMDTEERTVSKMEPYWRRLFASRGHRSSHSSNCNVRRGRYLLRPLLSKFWRWVDAVGRPWPCELWLWCP